MPLMEKVSARTNGLRKNGSAGSAAVSVSMLPRSPLSFESQYSGSNSTSDHKPVSKRAAQSSDGNVRSPRHGITRSTSAAAAMSSPSHTSNKYLCHTRIGTVVQIGSLAQCARSSADIRCMPASPAYSSLQNLELPTALDITARDAVLKLHPNFCCSTSLTAFSKASSSNFFRRMSDRKIANTDPSLSTNLSVRWSPGMMPAELALPLRRTPRTARLESCTEWWS
mmetsp:Transcript_49842/g.143450  ORF Transcript_49842/g.143450 Transcript_49842/m.143450 type:complete len:225 (-) Transcript_49842:916-1590(-)